MKATWVLILFSSFALAEVELTPATEPDPRPVPKPGATGISVQTINLNKKFYGVKLLEPHHKSVFTSGYVKFKWKLAGHLGKKTESKKTKYKLVIENVRSGKKFNRTTTANEWLVNFKEGDFRWHVQTVSKSMPAESPWRLFQIVSIPMGRDVSSSQARQLE